MKKSTDNNLVYVILALALGLAPFYPEPHIIGKIRWVLGGGIGMRGMDYFDLFYHGLPWIFIVYLLVKYIMNFNKKRKIKGMDIKNLISQKKTQIIDVRENYEFRNYHIEGARNIPLSKLDAYMDEIKKIKGPIILYCQSGNRSGIAVDYLKSKGIENTYNGGGLYDMKKLFKAA